MAKMLKVPRVCNERGLLIVPAVKACLHLDVIVMSVFLQALRRAIELACWPCKVSALKAC